ncbi:phage head closure protein [Staphylococcus haemolyticus]
MAYHFNNRIEILEVKSNDGPEAFGSIKVVIATPWADVRTMKGNEFQQWRLTANKENVRFIIRYRKGINPRQYVRYNGKDYNIVSVTNDNGMNQTLTIFAEVSD